MMVKIAFHLFIEISPTVYPVSVVTLTVTAVITNRNNVNWFVFTVTRGSSLWGSDLP